MFTTVNSKILIAIAMLTVAAPQAYAGKAKPAAKSSPAPASSNMLPGTIKPKAPDLTPQYNAYVNRLRTKINGAWNYPDGKNHVVISCVLSADGNVSDFHISSSPQSAAAEEAANAAFNQSQPFETLPGNTPSARLTLTFESTSTQHDSSSNLSTRLDPLGKVAVPPDSSQ